ncbi:tryptophan 7-halogenase [Porphyrobacter sp. ULC335]|uniref:tryptophan 7-halogenase n=1 Tax=Porphyrobacter sp. ULC335 TaxID=2854260 RepID=UPI0022211AF2|nr:tryptophan 7-halogenase [Porphyrobacter sp. ULC335]UYV15489.1 tryptophan 7-halogenase [Porphyrobacter sp. ULC335]
MSQPRAPLRRVVVVGGGQLGVLAAIALRRSLPGCEVVVIGTQPSPAAFADWSPTAMPFTNKLHDRLGIAEEDIVTKAGGSYRLVTRYAGWGGAGQEGVTAYGEALDPALKTAFARAWGKVRPLAEGAPPAGSIAQVLAEAGRFAPPPPGEPTPISAVDYALRWHPGAYRALLIQHAEALGVAYVQGVIDRIEPGAASGDGDAIAAIGVTGQGMIAADLFIDCSGPQASLLAAHPRFAFTDWSAALPTRHVYLAEPSAPVIALEDRVTLASAGWLAEVAGRDGRHAMLGTAAPLERGAAEALLGASLRGAVALSPGRAAAPWIGNIIALGDAAARFDPLGPLHLDLAHRQLALLIEMLPGRDISPLERAEYNRRSGLMMDGVCEVIALHYAASGARAVFGDRPVPGQGAAVIDQFERRGRIPFREELPLLGQEQFALLVALGWAPGLPPAARGEDAAGEARARAAFESEARAALAFAPPYAEWLARALSANRAPAG